MSDETRKRIEEEIKAHKVVIYMKGTPELPQCGFSAATVRLFDSLGVRYATVDVLADPEIRRGIKEYSSWPTIPQVYVAGEFIGGCDIVHEMHDRGELEPLLKKALAS